MRPHGSQEKLQQQRQKALTLRQQGYGPSEIARMLETTAQSVCRWVRAYRRRGAKALAAKPAPGRPPKMSVRQKRGLVRCLLKGASAFGFGTDLWTCPRIAQVIEQRYRVHYHVDHIPRLITSLGFSPSQGPDRIHR
jgi:transposase